MKPQSPTTHVPPQNIEAEESVIGAMLIAGSALTRVIDEVKLNAADFYLDRHRAIFEAAHDLYAAGKPVDAITVAEALTPTQAKVIEKTGMSTKLYVSNLAATVAAPGNVEHHAEIVQQNANLARLDKALKLGREAFDNRNGGPPDKVWGRVFELVEAAKPAAGSRAGEIATVKGSDVRLRAPRFLDGASMILRRSITVGVGGAGLGKTIYALGQCAAVTAGRMTGLDGPQAVLISSQEDDPEAVLAPRLVAAGANLELVHFVTGLSLPSQIPALASRARTLGAVLIVIDPIAAHLDPNIDSHRDAATRAALAPLAEMATDLDLAVLVIAHPNKSTGSTGLDRISGSGAFGNAARSVIVFGADPTDPEGEAGTQRVIAHLKCNVAKRSPSIAATIETTQVETEDGMATVPRLSITGLSTHSADDVLASPTGDERSERDEARTFLADLLAGGSVRTKEIKDAAKDADIAWRTVERAKRDLDVGAVKRADGWYWEMQS